MFYLCNLTKRVLYNKQLLRNKINRVCFKRLFI